MNRETADNVDQIIKDLGVSHTKIVYDAMERIEKYDYPYEKRWDILKTILAELMDRDAVEQGRIYA